MAKLNKNEFKWLIILISFACYIYHLLITGKINFFIHPRMIKYIQFSLVILLLLVLVQFKRLFLPQANKKRRISFFVFLTPVLLGFLINPQGLNGEIAAKKEGSFFQKSIQSLNTNPIQNGDSSPHICAEHENTSDFNSSKTKKAETMVPSLSKDALIVIKDNNFTQFIDDLTGTPSKYIGKEVSITGFVFKDRSTKSDEFVIARLMLMCCAADAEITGILCDFEKASSLQTDQWIKVVGEIHTVHHEYQGEDQIIPMIHVKKIESIPKPKNPYIYPK